MNKLIAAIVFAAVGTLTAGSSLAQAPNAPHGPAPEVHPQAVPHAVPAPKKAKKPVKHQAKKHKKVVRKVVPKQPQKRPLPQTAAHQQQNGH